MAPQSGLKGRKGFTLIEIMIAMVVSLFIMAGVYNVFQTMTKSNLSIKASSEMQQNVRATLNAVTKLMTMAGYQGSCGETHAHGIIYQRDPNDNRDSDNSIVSGPNSVCFTYWDEDPAYVYDHSQFNQERRIQIYLDSSKKEVHACFESFNKNTGIKMFQKVSDVVLARNISKLAFTYYDGSSNAITPNATNITTVRKVTTTVTGLTTFAQLIQNSFRSFSLSSDIKPVNLGIEGHAVDVTPPSKPTGLYVTDPHICTQLQVTWNANTEVDLAGYTIFYGTSTGQYDHRVDVGKVTSYTLDNLVLGLTDPKGYYITMVAFDTSGNISPMADEVYTGAVTPGHTDPNDTYPNINNPSKPTGLIALAGPGNGQVTLTWNSNPASDGIVSYRVYRIPIPNPASPPDFSGYPIPAAQRVDNGIGDGSLNTIKSLGSQWTFTDSSGLIGCTIYEYAVCGVNCDSSLIDGKTVNGTFIPPTYSSDQYSRIYGGTYVDNTGNTQTIGSPNVTEPTDGTPPASPINLVGVPGSNRVYLSWKNPSDADFKGVIIKRSTSAYPHNIDEGDFVVDYTLKGSGEVCQSTDTTALNNTCYYYSAFAYDKCGNYSSPAYSTNMNGSSQQVCSKPCSDGIPGSPEYGAPPAPPTNQYNMYYCSLAAGTVNVNLRWADPSNLSSITDFTGYNVYRTDYTSGPVMSNFKGGNPNTYAETRPDGGVYSYYVTAVDCSGNESGTLNQDGTPGPGVVMLTSYPGKLYYDPNAAVTVSMGTYHNTLQFDVSNTSSHLADLQKLKLTWNGGGTETNALLTNVSIWDSNANAWTSVYSGSGVTTGTPFALSPFSVPQAPNGPGSQANVPMRFTWKNAADGSVNINDDMRNANVTISFTYSLSYFSTFDNKYHESDPTLCGCDPIPYNVSKATGPTFLDVTQSQPVAGTFAETQTAYLLVPPDQSVDVSAFVTDTSPNLAGMKYVELFYAITTRDITTPPTIGTAPDNINLKSGNPTGYTCITTIAVNPGTDYVQYGTSYGGVRRSIPANNNSRVWYFFVAKDNNGNFTRWPAPADPEKIYTYDQLGSGGSGSGGTTVSVNITAPTNGSTVTSTTTVMISATSTGAGVSNVMLSIDGQIYQGCSYVDPTATTPGYWSFVLDPSVLPNGTHTLTAMATTTDYHSATSTISFTVNNSGTSVTASLVSPASGATISGTQTIQVSATATGASGSQISVSVSINGNTVPCNWNKNTSKYEYVWDTTAVGNGAYTLVATASYNGSSGTSSTNQPNYTVNVVNTVVNLTAGYFLSPSTNLAPFAGDGSTQLSGSTTIQASAGTTPSSVGITGVTIDIDGANRAQAMTVNSNNGYWEYVLDVSKLSTGQHTLAITSTAADTYGTKKTVNVTFTVGASMTVQVAAPANYAQISNTNTTISLSVTANVNNSQLTVQALVSADYGNTWQSIPCSYNNSSKYWECTWQSSSAANGTYLIKGEATSGTSAYSTPITVTVSNTVISNFAVGYKNGSTNGYSLSGATLSGTATIQATAQSANSGVTSVVLQVDNSTQKQSMSLNSTTGYWEYALDTTTLDPSITHTVTITVTTADGHSATLTSPAFHVAQSITASITSPANNANLSGTVTITISTASNATVTGAQVSFDGGTTWSPASTTSKANIFSYSWDTIAANIGTSGPQAVTILARGVNSNNNTFGTNSSPVNVTVDNSTGYITINTPTSGADVTSSTTLDCTVASTHGSVQSVSVSITGSTTYQNYALTNTSGSDWQCAINPAYITPGLQTLTVTAYISGNRVGTSSITINVPPSITSATITSPANGAVVSNTVPVTFTVNANSPVTGAQVSIDGVTNSCTVSGSNGTYTCTYNWDTTAASYGSHTIQGTAYCGTTSKTTNSISVTVDNTVVTVSIISPTGGDQSGTITILASASSNGAGITSAQIKVDSTNLNTTLGSYWQATLDTTTLTAGLHTITCTATASDNKTGQASVSINVPVFVNVSVVQPAANSTVSGTTTIQLQPTTNPGGSITSNSVQFQIDGTGSWYTCTNNSYSFNTASLSNGLHSIVGKASNGTTTGYSSPVSFTVDNSAPPSINIKSPLNNATITASATLQVAATANYGTIASVQASYDNVTWSSCTYNSTTGYWEQPIPVTPPIACTRNTIYVKATTSTGKTNTANSTFYVDATSLQCSVQSPGSNAYVTTTWDSNKNMAYATITITTGTTGDAVAGVTVSVDGGAYGAATETSPGSNTWTYIGYFTNTGSLSHTISAIATAASCSLYQPQATTSVSVNVPMPKVPATSGDISVTPAGGSTISNPSTSISIRKGTSVTWKISASDNYTGIQAVYGIDNQSHPSGVNITSTLSGGYYSYTVTLPSQNNKTDVFEFEAVDRYGNQAYTVTYTVTTTN